MEWMLLLADVGLVGLLVRLWLNYQTSASDLRRREQAAVQRTAEYRQEVETLRKEIEAVETELPEHETLAGTLKEEVEGTEERLARLELSVAD